MKDIAVILDVDGLMVDTEPIARLVWGKVLAQYGYQLNDTLHSRMIGYRRDESARTLLDEFQLSLAVKDLQQMVEAEFAKIVELGVPVMPGLFELLSAIDHHKVPWAVATTSPYAHAERILHQLSLEDSCHAIAAGDEVPRGKPAPDVYLLAAKRLGVPQMHCMALEDSATGCRSALAAGMMTVAIPYGGSKTADFPEVHQLFNSLHKVSQELDRLLLELNRR